MLEVFEHGSGVDIRHYKEFLTWEYMLRLYADKLLTHSSDRLPALRGIVASMQKTLSDQFFFKYGVARQPPRAATLGDV